MNLYGSTRDYAMFDEHVDLNNGIVCIVDLFHFYVEFSFVFALMYGFLL